jgi:hypothetical protein
MDMNDDEVPGNLACYSDCSAFSPIDEFGSILPSSGFTRSENLSDDMLQQLAHNVRAGWKVESDIPFKNLKPGDKWYDGEPIVFIDHERNVIVTDDDGSINYYYITNPDEKKSNYFEGNYSRYSFLY